MFTIKYEIISEQFDYINNMTDEEIQYYFYWEMCVCILLMQVLKCNGNGYHY